MFFGSFCQIKLATSQFSSACKYIPYRFIIVRSDDATLPYHIVSYDNECNSDVMAGWRTYVVADAEDVGEVRLDVGVITSTVLYTKLDARSVDVGVVAGHERRVADDAQRDEEVDERVHDEQFHVAREPVPAGRAVPVEQQLVDLVQRLLLPTVSPSRTAAGRPCPAPSPSRYDHPPAPQCLRHPSRTQVCRPSQG